MRVQILVDGLTLVQEQIPVPTREEAPMAGQLGFWLVQAAKQLSGYYVPRNLEAMTVSFESTDR